MPQAWVTDYRIVQVERGLAVSYHDHLTEPDRHEPQLFIPRSGIL
jgi:hypothetical protein